MAAELRLILLGLGVALVVGLWWWERRRADAPRAEPSTRSPELLEPHLGGEDQVARPESPVASPAPVAEPVDEMDTQELPARRAPTLDRPVPRGDPPVITIDNLPEETIDVVLESPAVRAEEAPVLRTSEAMRTRPDLRRRVPDPPIIDEPEEASEEPARFETPEPEVSDDEPIETPPRHQRIIAVRLMGRDGQRMEGKDLKAALGSEGLEFGRYSIYHRVVDGGRPLYSVASLVEPGSFDPVQMESLRFPGVSLFAVFPGPLPAPQCFDELLATARRLADRLGGTLQDESGSSLTGQRVLSIREDLVHFEHLVSLSRTRPRP